MKITPTHKACHCFGLAQWLGGSGFIAAFVGGLIFGGLTHKHKEEFLRGAEGAGDTLSLITWFTFGVVVLGPQFQHLNWQVALHAVLSLTVVRMLPVLLCLVGKQGRLDTKLFLGWFGPRGLASIVFIVMVADKKLPENDVLPMQRCLLFPKLSYFKAPGIELRRPQGTGLSHQANAT